MDGGVDDGTEQSDMGTADSTPGLDDAMMETPGNDAESQQQDESNDLPMDDQGVEIHMEIPGNDPSKSEMACNSIHASSNVWSLILSLS